MSSSPQDLLPASLLESSPVSEFVTRYLDGLDFKVASSQPLSKCVSWNILGSRTKLELKLKRLPLYLCTYTDTEMEKVVVAHLWLGK